MYTHDQINAIALNLNISPQLFYPENAVQQILPKKDPKQSLAKANAIKEKLISLIKDDLFRTEKSVKQIVDEIGAFSRIIVNGTPSGNIHLHHTKKINEDGYKGFSHIIYSEDGDGTLR
ncbi:hypothetical protein [Sphingobacterium sp. xlx-130]|uniref:hypothetical protein n=1 Tax=Sphingobacterium sp. xlx-130 TaxID=2654323 RepID=UPI0013DB1E40|nr:hypothetical protein [Sphingobacterium sp. xlx-130]